jgi:protoporphyrin/coproporphyrin ferrochelatase
MPKKVAVLIATYGEVEAATLKNLFPNSQRILYYITSKIANLPKPLQLFIATVRSFKRRKHWTRLNYRSQLNPVTREQTVAVQHALTELNSGVNGNMSGTVYDVREAYYFVPPYFETVMKSVASYDAIIVVPMIPVESRFSCGIACDITASDFSTIAFHKVRVLRNLWNDDDLVQIFVNHLFAHTAKAFANTPKAKVGLALSVHGTLVKNNDGNTPSIHTGYQETLDFFEKLKTAIERDRRNFFTSIKIGAMNHKFGGEWMPETLDKSLKEFRAEGVETVVKFPYGFFADNSEADLEGCEEVRAAGFELVYVPCINAAPEFAAWLAKRIRTGAERLIDAQTATGATAETYN